MNSQTWITIVSAIAVCIVNLGVIGKWFKSHKAQILAAIPGIVAGAKAVEQSVTTAVEDVAKMPGVGVVKTVMGTEIHNVENALRHSQILQVAGTALHTFLADLSSLNDTQLGSIKIFVESELKKLGVTVTPEEVLTALKDVQTAADALKKSPVYVDTMKLVQSSEAMKQAATPAPATTAATA